jgi:4-diphosphocytidyl-2-C-methyl-D-erythritol kinase
MIRFPNAKINLGLNITSKRPDGYHNLETIFYPIGLKDALEIVISEQTTDQLHISGMVVDGPIEKNLVMRALAEIRKQAHIPPLDIYLHKVIPFGAGLGGGSADAAAMLILLNDKFQLGITEPALLDIASRLGADCAFFIQNRPVFASGIGNIFQQIDCSLAGYHLVLVKPPISVSTPEAYSLIKPEPCAISLLEIIKKPIAQWQQLMKNDFEKSVFSKYPQIESIKKRLIDNGALYASMSGSGSSVFGIFEREPSFAADEFAASFVWGNRLE